MDAKIQRANRLAKTLRRYSSADTELCNLIDVLADARHWCDSHGEDFAQTNRTAHGHYLWHVIDPRGGAL